MKNMFDGREKFSTRERTPEGYLRAKAAVTRVGVFEYDAAELGVGNAGDLVKVMRTKETSFHPDTIKCVRGAPVTIGHPTGGVSPSTWRDHTVGNIVGDPVPIDENRLGAEILIGDREGIEAIESGQAELSIGYTFDFKKASDRADYDYESTGPLGINHVAIVNSTRAGPTVRVFDKKLEQTEMATEDIAKIVKDALDESLKDIVSAKDGAEAAETIDTEAISRAVNDAVSPAIDEMKKMMREAAEAKMKEEEEAKRKAAKEAAKKAADSLVADTIRSERERAKVMADALPLIDDEKRPSLEDADLKDILIAAVGDTVPNAADQNVEYLRGVVSMLANDRKRAENSRDGRTLTTQTVDAKSREEAYAIFVDSYAQTYHDPDGDKN